MRCERCEELEEEIRQLREQLTLRRRAPRSWGLTRTEERILLHMASRIMVTRDSTMMVLYGDRATQPDPQILQVMVHRIRRKMAVVLPELTIVSVHGVGWEVVQGRDALLMSLVE